MIRQPIVVTIGHIDHGKTTLLDKVRHTAVQAKEAGGITQAIGATEIPTDIVNKICGPLLERLKIKIGVPGLLFIDTPGHEAFTAIRKRGSSLADLAILVIDINEGFQAQTDESVRILKEFQTPFIVAATKIDRIDGWISNENECFIDTIGKQPEWVVQKFDEVFYKLVGQLSERGFESERFDRVDDFSKTVVIVPCSGITGEGVPEILMALVGLSQAFLKKNLEVTKGIGRGSILEVKEVKGLGKTIDVILYDGETRKGDWLIVGGKEPIVTKIKALLKPNPLKEIRVEKKFQNVDHVSAASGIKIAALNLDDVIAGSPIATVHNEKDIEKVKQELQTGIEQIEFEATGEGIILKADNLGSLEALVGVFKERVDIKKAEIGKVLRKDVMEIDAVKDRLKKVIIAFNVDVDVVAAKEAKDKSLKIVQNNIIYKLIEEFDGFIEEQKQMIRKEKLESIIMPAKIKLLPGHVFRVSGPAIVGIEVLAGTIKTGFKLQRNGKEIGTIKAIQSESKSVDKAVRGDKVAISIAEPTVGRHIKEGEELVTKISKDDLKVLQELDMTDEIQLAKEILVIE